MDSKSADTRYKGEPANRGVAVRAAGAKNVFVLWLASGTGFATVGALGLSESPAALVLVSVGLGLLTVGVRGIRARVVLKPEALLVCNLFRNVTLSRSEILAFDVWPSQERPKAAPGVVVRMRGGGSIAPTALQLGGAIWSSGDRYEAVQSCAERLDVWLRTGDPASLT